ncbi:MAG TPA: FkbM family methyltransferase, partial [Myxococcota bacterium]|nr:FkbM family methyltransferase [Myxococcota bacterium]
PENAALLRRNLRANGALRAEVEECAVADVDGVLPLFLGRSGTTHQLFARDHAQATGESVEVRVATLPGLLAKHGIERVDFLKLDCEGAEGRILPALPDELFAGLRAVALEFHDDASPLSHQRLQELLAARGFRVRCAWDGRSANGMLFAHR